MYNVTARIENSRPNLMYCCTGIKNNLQIKEDIFLLSKLRLITNRGPLFVTASCCLSRRPRPSSSAAAGIYARHVTILMFTFWKYWWARSPFVRDTCPSSLHCCPFFAVVDSLSVSGVQKSRLSLLPDREGYHCLYNRQSRSLQNTQHIYYQELDFSSNVPALPCICLDTVNDRACIKIISSSYHKRIQSWRIAHIARRSQYTTRRKR